MYRSEAKLGQFDGAVLTASSDIPGMRVVAVCEDHE